MSSGKMFKIDELLKAHGHIVVRLPPYLCDLNAIEYAWSQVKRYVREHNVSEEILLKLTIQGLDIVTTQDWGVCCDKEEEYWDHDGM